PAPRAQDALVQPVHQHVTRHHLPLVQPHPQASRSRFSASVLTHDLSSLPWDKNTSNPFPPPATSLVILSSPATSATPPPPPLPPGMPGRSQDSVRLRQRFVNWAADLCLGTLARTAVAKHLGELALDRALRGIQPL